MHTSMPQHQVDRLDRAIVTRLQVDGRIANVDLADAVSLSPSACLRRVKTLESSGIIAGYRAEVDRAKAGLGLTVFIELRVEGHSQETSARLEKALTSIPAVVACYVVSPPPRSSPRAAASRSEPSSAGARSRWSIGADRPTADRAAAVFDRRPALDQTPQDLAPGKLSQEMADNDNPRQWYYFDCILCGRVGTGCRPDLNIRGRSTA